MTDAIDFGLLDEIDEVIFWSPAEGAELARELWEKSVGGPGESVGWLALGSSCRSLGSLKAARACYHRASKAPRTSRLRYELCLRTAVVHQQLGKVEPAARLLADGWGLARTPVQRAQIASAASTLYAIRDAARAMYDLAQIALRELPADSPSRHVFSARFNAAGALTALGKLRMARREILLLEGLRQTPHADWLMGTWYRASDQPEMALECFRRAVEGLSGLSQPLAALDLAEVLAETEDIQASTDLARVVMPALRSTDATVDFARAIRLSGLDRAAIAALRSSILAKARQRLQLGELPL